MSSTYQINNHEVYIAIQKNYANIYAQAILAGLPTNNIQIRLRSDLKEALELGDVLFFSHIGCDVSIIVDDTIEEQMTPDGQLKSHIYIYDPDWPNWTIPKWLKQ